MRGDGERPHRRPGGVTGKLLLALGCAATVVAAACGTEPGVENVLLISIDTLRADRLGSYGYDRPTSPSLDRLAAEGARFSDAVSNAAWTTPSHMTLMTSLQPSSHTVMQDWAAFLEFREGNFRYRTLPESVTTLAQVLHDAGFETLALTGGGPIASDLGFGRGFDVYVEGPRKLSAATWSQLTRWIEDPGRRPFFIFFHTFEVHAPYLRLDLARDVLSTEEAAALERFIHSSEEHTEDDLRIYLQQAGLYRVEVTSRLYDSGIRFTDRFLGRLFDALRENGLWDRTLVVVTSDHGEEFADHRRGKFYNNHCHTLYEEIIRVPLIVRVPGRFDDGRVIAGQVRLLDVAPTLLDLLDLPIPAQMQGVSAVDRLEVPGAPATAPPEAFSEAICFGPEQKSLRSRGMKYVVGFSEADERVGIPGVPAWEELYDLSQDPGETRDLSADSPEILARMRERLFHYFRYEAVPVGDRDAAPRLAIDPETERQLRALGYLN